MSIFLWEKIVKTFTKVFKFDEKFGEKMKKKIKNYFSKIRYELKNHWKNYVFQNLMASSYIFLVMFLYQLNNAVIATSIGASAFIVFAMPRGSSAKTKNVIFGYFICGFVAYLWRFTPIEIEIMRYFVYPIAVGCAFFLMTILDFEHPPALGLTISVLLDSRYVRVFIFSLISVSILCIIKYLLRKHIRNLV